MEAGGKVHTLLGNHELLNLDGQFHYVSPDELSRLAEGSRGSSTQWRAGEQQRAGLAAWRAQLQPVHFISILPSALRLSACKSFSRLMLMKQNDDVFPEFEPKGIFCGM